MRRQLVPRTSVLFYIQGAGGVARAVLRMPPHGGSAG